MKQRVADATVRHLALGQIGYADFHGNAVGEDGKPLPRMSEVSADLLDCRARIRAWEPTMLAVEKGVRNPVHVYSHYMKPLADSVSDGPAILAAFRAIPPEHRPEPQWEPSKVDVAIVAGQVRKFSVVGSEGIAEQVLKALQDAGRLK